MTEIMPVPRKLILLSYQHGAKGWRYYFAGLVIYHLQFFEKIGIVCKKIQKVNKERAAESLA